VGSDKVYYPDIGVFSFYDDKLMYKIHTPESLRRFRYHSEEIETIEEARKIVEEQNGGR